MVQLLLPAYHSPPTTIRALKEKIMKMKSQEEIYSEELDQAYKLMADYKATLIMCRVTMDAILGSPDDAPLSILRPYLQTRIDQINELGI